MKRKKNALYLHNEDLIPGVAPDLKLLVVPFGVLSDADCTHLEIHDKTIINTTRKNKCEAVGIGGQHSFLDHNVTRQIYLSQKLNLFFSSC